MDPITTLELDVLLERLRAREQQILRLIDEDEHLKRREREDGLVIANSGPSLFEPQFEHQLFAKGIVYRRAPYALVSLPLVKMFNHGLREHSDRTSREVLAREEPVRVTFPEKLDGTMIQLFAHEGRAWLTTRSVLEGTGRDVEGDFLALARAQLERAHPHLLDPEVIGGKSLIFELIHPKTRQVTNYGADHRMVLLSVFDLERYHYWSTRRVLAWARQREVEHPELLIDQHGLDEGVARLRAELGEDPRIPEGAIVCFEQGDRIVHRVKVKTEEYLHHFSMRFRITFKGVADMLWEHPEWRDWDAFIAHLSAEKMSEEEVEAFYREHFDRFMEWFAQIEARHARVTRAMRAWESERGPRPDGDDARRAWFKALAAHARQHHDEDFALIMSWARRGPMTLDQIMWHNPVYPGFRSTLADAGVRG